MASTIGWLNPPGWAKGESWNFVEWCNPMSPGCENCYAMTLHESFRKRGFALPQYQQPFWNADHSIFIARERLSKPLHWRSPRLIFVNSMSDLFHEKVPLSLIRESFDIMRQCPQHVFIALTKRPNMVVRAAENVRSAEPLIWPRNLIMGVSIENADYWFRKQRLVHAMQIVRERQGYAPLAAISFEPLLGPLAENLDLSGIGWGIMGAESGKNPRQMDMAWVEDLARQLREADIPIFFKQAVFHNGRQWVKNETPALWGDVVQEWPDFTQFQERGSTLWTPSN